MSELKGVRFDFEEKLDNNKFINFGDIIEYISKGETPRGKGDEYSENGVKFLRVVNLTEDRILLENAVFIDQNVHDRMKRSQLKNGDLLYSMAGTIGLCQLVDQSILPANINQAIAVIRLKQGNNRNYIRHILNIPLIKNQALSYSTQTSQPNINFEQIKSLQIPLPPLPIQQKLADMMDEAYALKKAKETEAKELLDSVDSYVMDKLGIVIVQKEEKKVFAVSVSSLFGGRIDPEFNLPKFKKIELAIEKSNLCKKYKLGDLITSLRSGTTPSTKNNPFCDEGIPFLRNSEMQDSQIVLDKIKYVKKELGKSLTFSKKGDLIICIAGTIGVNAVNTIDKTSAKTKIST